MAESFIVWVNRMDCKSQWSDYITAQDQVRKHVEKTGHTVQLEVGSAYTYTKKK